MDLATLSYVQSIIPDLAPGEVAALPGMISTASSLIQRWCNRQLGFQAGIEELVAPEQSGLILLSEFPVITIHRVSGTPVTALTVTSTNPAVQRAQAEIPAASPEGLVGTVLNLTAKSLGTVATQQINFTSLIPPTIGTLAAAISALPGWQGTVAEGYEDWGWDELLAGQGVQSAGANAASGGAEFLIHSEDLGFTVDKSSGLVTVVWGGSNDPFSSMRFGPVMQEDWNSFETQGDDQGIRINYDAGYVTIPLDLQLATAELVKATFERMATSSVLQSERTDKWAWTAREFGEIVGGMPESVRQVVSSYRDHAR